GHHSPISNFESFTNSFNRSAISALVSCCKRSVPNFSTQKDAKAEANMSALFIASKLTEFNLDKYPIKPPAKESPAPVGSNTSARGSAGAENTCPSPNNNAPCSPFLIMRYFGPIVKIVDAAFTNEYSPDN